jgi:hypothetical protein
MTSPSLPSREANSREAFASKERSVRRAPTKPSAFEDVCAGVVIKGVRLVWIGLRQSLRQERVSKIGHSAEGRICLSKRF